MQEATERIDVTRPERRWLAIAVTFAAVCGALAVADSYRSEFVAPSDARPHAFWAARYTDTELFNQDPLADYFEAITPVGVRACFWLAAQAGIDALTLVKWLPLLLAMTAALYAFRLTRALGGPPPAALLASVLLTVALWMRDDTASGTARAFASPLLAAFLFYAVRRAWAGTGVTAVALTVCYPPVGMVALGGLTLDVLVWHPNGRRDITTTAGILVAACALLLFQAHGLSQYGPVLTAEIGRTLPQLAPLGRYEYFVNGPVYWTYAYRSGAVALYEPAPALLGWLLPAIGGLGTPLSRLIASRIRILGMLSVSAAVLFGAAHLTLFRLYEPSRYTVHLLRLLLAVGSALVCAAVVDRIKAWRPAAGRLFAAGLAAGIVIVVGAQLLWLGARSRPFPFTHNSPAHLPELMRFLSTTPKGTRIATLLEDGDDIPIFAKRTVLAANGFGLPWHLGFYRPFEARMNEAITSLYSPSLAEVQAFVRRNDVDLIVAAPEFMRAGLMRNARWFEEYHAAAAPAAERLERGQVPALVLLGANCVVFTTGPTSVYASACIESRASR